MLVVEFDNRTDKQRDLDHLFYLSIDPCYGTEKDDDLPLNEKQLRALNSLIILAQKEQIFGDSFSLINAVLTTYEVDRFEELTQGMYRKRVVSFILLHFPNWWMTIPEKIQEKEWDKISKDTWKKYEESKKPLSVIERFFMRIKSFF